MYRCKLDKWNASSISRNILLDMSKKLIIFGILISSVALNAYAEMLVLTQDSPEYQECKKISPNSVSQIDIYPASPTIDQSLSAREIADLRKKLIGFSDAKNHGMTYAKLRHQYVVNGKAKLACHQSRVITWKSLMLLMYILV